MKSRSLLPLLLLLLGALVLGALGAAGLEVGCGRESISLDSELVRQADAQLGAGSVSFDRCPEPLLVALKHLQRLLALDEQTCSQAGANQIREHHDKYLATNETLGRYPREARTLFVAHSLILSDVCRKQLLEELVVASHSLLNHEDVVLLDQLTDLSGFMGHFIIDPKDYGDLVVPKTLTKLLGIQTRAIKNDKLYVQLATGKIIRRMQAFCNSRLAPLYESLMMPLVTMASVGFNYEAQVRASRDPETNRLVYKWYRGLMVCESLKNIVVVGGAQAKVADNDSDKQVIKLISREEAANSAKKAESPANSEFKPLCYNKLLSDLAKINSTHDSGSLSRAIQRWHKPSTRVGWEILRDLVPVLRKYISNGKYKLVAKLPGQIKGLLRTSKSPRDGAELVTAVEELARELRRRDLLGDRDESFGLVKLLCVGFMISMIIGAVNLILALQFG